MSESSPVSSLISSHFNFFQVAYVTPDLDAGMAECRRLLGLDRFFVSRDVPITTRDGEAKLHFALVFRGQQQVELIQPAGGADGVYRSALGAGVLRLHHLGHLVSDETAWRMIERDIEASGLPTPVGGAFAHEGAVLMHYRYVDLRATLGHYLEFMYQTEAGRDLFAQVPRL
jgi:hypothetical protein